MVAFITKNEWSSPFTLLLLNKQKNSFLKLAKKHKGFRGLQMKWHWNGVYFMTLWKTEEQLHAFLEKDEVKRSFETRVKSSNVSTITLSAINFIPWQEVYSLMDRNSKQLQAN